LKEPNITEPHQSGPEPPRSFNVLHGVARTFGALRHRDFRLLWAGAITSTTGTWMQTVAQGWVVLSMSGSAFYLGIDAFLATLPMILFSLVGGVIADRIDRRKILIVSQLSQMAVAFFLAGLIYSGAVEVWHIFVLSFLTGTAQAFGAPAYQALLPLLVTRDDVPNAIALNSMQFNLARMMGPVLAGIALATVGAAACFLLNGLSFIPVILSLFAVRSSFRPERAAARGMIAQMREGFESIRQHPAISKLTAIAFAATFLGAPVITLLPAVAKSVFGLSAGGYSSMVTVYGAGSVTGAILLASGVMRGRGRRLLHFLLAFSGFLFLFTMSRNLIVSHVLLFCAAASLLGVITNASSLVQLATPEAVRGRVMSIFLMAFRGGMPLGSLTTGYFAERFSVMTALLMNAVGLAIVGALALMSERRYEARRG
jgi:predicted MFS family arabinose efflux permease